MQVESYTIGFIPEAARYGHPWRLFTIWFGCNLQLLGLSIGAFGTLAGLSLGWTVAALLVGNAIGTVFMAAHSAQGPQLGVPQMIQSRAQFGVMGAALPLLAVVVAYMLYTALDAIIVRHAVQTIVPVSDDGAIIVFNLAALVVAFIGYELIHRMGIFISVASAVVLGAAAIILVGEAHWPHAASPLRAGSNGFVATAFLITVSQSASWCLSASPYVADYSRYLPADTSPARTFWFTASGNFLGAQIIMTLGAFIAQHFPAITQDPSIAIPSLFGVLGGAAKASLILAVFLGAVMNFYSSYMSLVTIVTGRMTRLAISKMVKLVIMGVVMLISTALALLTKDNFDRYFSDVLGIVIYMLIPWSAINLADYYFVRRGHYIIEDLFDARGSYGSFNPAAIAIYLAAVAVQMPFMRLSFFEGVIAQRTSADLAWVPGLIVPALLFTLIKPKCIKS